MLDALREIREEHPNATLMFERRNPRPGRQSILSLADLQKELEQGDFTDSFNILADGQDAGVLASEEEWGFLLSLLPGLAFHDDDPDET